MKRTKHKNISKDIPNCWEIMNCSTATCNKCPAHPNMGRECWKTTGARCNAGHMRNHHYQKRLFIVEMNVTIIRHILKKLIKD
jgi:hypothetical protein